MPGSSWITTTPGPAALRVRRTRGAVLALVQVPGPGVEARHGPIVTTPSRSSANRPTGPTCQSGKFRHTFQYGKWKRRRGPPRRGAGPGRMGGSRGAAAGPRPGDRRRGGGPGRHHGDRPVRSTPRGRSGRWPGDCVLFGVVAAVQLWRFTRLNGVRVRGFASKVVFGSAATASFGYAVALVVAYAAAAQGLWWLTGCRRGVRGRRLRPQRPSLAARLPPGAGPPRCGGVDPLDRPGRRARRGRARPPGPRALMADLDPHLQAPARLKLVTMLTAVSEAEFAVVRDRLEVSDSVLSKHLVGPRRRGLRPGAQGRAPRSPDDVGVAHVARSRRRRSPTSPRCAR